MREDSAPWAWECRLWALKSLHVISGFYNLISEVVAENLSESRVRVVLWYLSWWQSVSSYSKCHFCFIKSSVYVSDKSTHVTNLKFGAKGQYLHSFYYLTRYFLASLLQSDYCHGRPSGNSNLWGRRSLYLPCDLFSSSQDCDCTAQCGASQISDLS